MSIRFAEKSQAQRRRARENSVLMLDEPRPQVPLRKKKNKRISGSQLARSLLALMALISMFGSLACSHKPSQHGPPKPTCPRSDDKWTGLEALSSRIELATGCGAFSEAARAQWQLGQFKGAAESFARWREREPEAPAGLSEVVSYLTAGRYKDSARAATALAETEAFNGTTHAIC